jgi:hypothetical protein
MGRKKKEEVPKKEKDKKGKKGAAPVRPRLSG